MNADETNDPLKLDAARAAPAESQKENEHDAAPDYSIQEDRRPGVSISTSESRSPSGSTIGYRSGSKARAPTATSRRTKKWTQNPKLMFAAAIVVGGVAAILIGKLILSLLAPATKPKYGRYGALPMQHVPIAGATAGLGTPRASVAPRIHGTPGSSLA